MAAATKLAAMAAALRIVLLSSVQLVSGASADVQIGITGAFKADRFVLRKASDFDDKNGRQMVVSDKLAMPGTAAWATFFIKNREDTELTIEADGELTTIMLTHDLFSDEGQRSKDAVRVKAVDVGDGRWLALVQVPDHFIDVWDTFHEMSKPVVLHSNPWEWEKLLVIAWEEAWAYWDKGRVYTLIFAHHLGASVQQHSVEIVFEEGGVQKSSKRGASDDIIWFATSVPYTGRGNSLFRVKVGPMETEDAKFDELPSLQSARCTALKSKHSDGGPKVFVAAFGSKAAYDQFKDDVARKVDSLWDELNGEWLFFDLAGMCGELRVSDGDGGTLDSENGGSLSDSVQLADTRHSSSAADEEPSSPMVLMASIAVAAAVVLLQVVWCLCRGAAPNESESMRSTILAPDIHGGAWHVEVVDPSADPQSSSTGRRDLQN